MKKRWWIRALRTLIQSALGYLAGALPLIDWENSSALKVSLAGLTTATIAAAMSGLANYFDEIMEDENDGD